MSSLLRRLIALWPILFLLPLPLLAAAQVAAAATPNLRQLTLKSGYIFAGTVTAVERISAPQSHTVATTQITFRVDQAIRGFPTGRAPAGQTPGVQTLIVREWAGLWEAGERYRTGERVLLFLYPLSKLGLTSPVGGTLGRFTLDKNGEDILEQERTLALMPEARSSAEFRNKTRVSRGDFARAIQRVAEE